MLKFWRGMNLRTLMCDSEITPEPADFYSATKEKVYAGWVHHKNQRGCGQNHLG